jgi:TFIIS helical bundle-like domain
MQELKASELGNAIMFLATLPMETNANRKLAKELVEKWSRGIFRISDKFEDLKVLHEERPTPTPRKKEEGVYDRLNGKLKKLKKKNKFLSIQERHHQMKREKLRKRTC